MSDLCLSECADVFKGKLNAQDVCERSTGCQKRLNDEQFWEEITFWKTDRMQAQMLQKAQYEFHHVLHEKSCHVAQNPHISSLLEMHHQRRVSPLFSPMDHWQHRRRSYVLFFQNSVTLQKKGGSSKCDVQLFCFARWNHGKRFPSGQHTELQGFHRREGGNVHWCSRRMSVFHATNELSRLTLLCNCLPDVWADTYILITATDRVAQAVR